MRRLVTICLLWLMLMTIASCSVERGADVGPLFDGPVQPAEMPEPTPSNIQPVDMPEPTPSGPPPVDMPEPSLVIKLTPEDILELDKPQHLEFTPAYTEEELVQVAKLLYQEARGIPSDTHVACVAWIVCNRVDGGYGDTISQIWVIRNYGTMKMTRSQTECTVLPKMYSTDGVWNVNMANAMVVYCLRIISGIPETA